jgi:hypothetical protein
MPQDTQLPLCRVVSLIVLLLGCKSYDFADDAPPCETVALKKTSVGLGIDKLDFIIVVDTSLSMAQEQAALARELPKLVAMLESGKFPNGEPSAYPRRDIHIGVISSDLGASSPAGSLAGCSREGDAARLRTGNGAAGCTDNYPEFLSYYAPDRPEHPLIAQPGAGTDGVVAQQIGCVAQLGSDGCALRQPLAAAVRALSPGGGHSDFLRNDPEVGYAELQIVVISDGDDCSARDAALVDTALTAPVTPISAVCLERPELLQDVANFADALRELRPRISQYLWFSAITGIPADLTNPIDVPGASNDSDEARRTYFAQLLQDPRMQPKLRTDGSLESVCENDRGSATPAPRLVEMALAFGGQADVRSICDPDWFRALTPIQNIITHRLSRGLECLRRIERTPEGLAPCRVTWELPLPGSAYQGSPTHCSDLPFLTPVARQPRTMDGGELCEVHQLLYRDQSTPPELEPGGGWFYDEFSGVTKTCSCHRSEGCSRILFMPDNPPAGVRVTLQCQETRCLTPGCDVTQCRVPG